ncbi:MAG: methylated-DNA--[protein]-cysteine S-methyltransferase [Bacteroidales bacterium]|nr:methylated-DNA--[protein]-cysteine S-methyltransferase [Bacteroidales bacterium]
MRPGNLECIIQTEWGPLHLASSGEFLTKCQWARIGECTNWDYSTEDDSHLNDVLKQTIIELNQYFQGIRDEFTIPLSPKGTPFQIQVWEAIMKIPYGETRTYKEIAEEIGNPQAFRAVGTACGNNPIAVIIPCHRVVGKSSPEAYSGPANCKNSLLAIEESKKFH